MTRRDFLRFFILGGLLSLFSKNGRFFLKVNGTPEKKAMFWRRLNEV